MIGRTPDDRVASGVAPTGEFSASHAHSDRTAAALLARIPTHVQRIADVIVAQASARPVRVVLFGSYARGAATPRSDVDLLLVVTPPPDSRWGPAENLAERGRMAATFGRVVPRVELWVRTAVQWEEASRVPGSVEHAAFRDGVVLYADRTTKPPPPRRTPEQVRVDNTRDWLRYARDLGTTLSAAAGRVPPRSLTLSERELLAFHALRTVQCAATAVCVWHQVPFPSKRADIEAVVEVLARADPDVAEWVRDAIGSGPPTVAGAMRVVDLVGACLTPLLR